MIIGACGFGSTGSSAVSDYLKEFDDISVIDDLEFTWVVQQDGLIDLEHKVMHPHFRTTDSIIAIERYLELMKRKMHSYEVHGLSSQAFQQSVEAFIDAITQVSWDWYDLRDDYKGLIGRYVRKAIMIRRFIPWMEKKKGTRISCYPMKKVRLSVKPQNFYEAARKHVSEMLCGMGADPSKHLVLDQPFSGDNPQAAFPFFHDAYAIVVDRDPRDNYVFARTRLLGRNHFMAVDTVEDFVKYYRALRDGQPYQEKHDRVLSIMFEDMVYHYDETTERIRAFLNLPENPNPRSIFEPSLSIANTQVYKRFPEFAKDIEVIERELPEYLFDFSRYPEPDPKGKMFFGKSPLNSGKKKV